MGLNNMLQHEVMHSAHIARGIWDQFVEQNPACANDPALKAEAAKIGDSIDAFYQKVAEKAAGCG